MTTVSTLELPVLDLAFRFGRSRFFGREIVFVGLAFGAHLGLALGVHPTEHVVVAPPRVTEVELAPPPPAPPIAEPPPASDDPVAATPLSTRAAPAAARAGALVTAKTDTPTAAKDELVDFVTDPNGTYGSGVVARGGTADHGALGAAVGRVGNVPAGGSKAGPSLVSASNLSRRATLREDNACAGFYPSEARDDGGTATVTVVVRADGSVLSTSIVSETPAGQGFGKAARARLQGKRFQPSLDRVGVAVDAATTIRLRFVR